MTALCVHFEVGMMRYGKSDKMYITTVYHPVCTQEGGVCV